MKKPLPKLRTDDEAERFVAEADLTEYDLSGLRMVQFEFEPKARASICGFQRDCSTPSRPRRQKPASPISVISDRPSKPLSSDAAKARNPRILKH